MADQSPESLRKPTGDVVNVNSTQGLNTLSIAGKTYQILDVGYVCGSTVACTVLSENTCLFDPAPYCSVCPTCFHSEGPAWVPDWEMCGTPAGTYGIMVKFKSAWICHCLKMIGYQSINVNSIQPVGTAAYCGAPSVPPPLSNFNPFPIVAGGGAFGGAIALGIASSQVGGGSSSIGIATSVTMPDGTVVDIDRDGAGVPFRPGIDSDINTLPTHPADTLPSSLNGCDGDTTTKTNPQTDSCA